jgi:RNA polymerase sigma-70 factor (ECF subfamily)
MPPPMVTPESWTSTLSLLSRARAGDSAAVDELFARYLPILKRWAAGRLPQRARDLADTPDLVQETLLQVFKRVGEFEHRGEGAFHAYLRQAVLNRIRNEIRNASRRPEREPLTEDLVADDASPFDAVLGSESVDRYEAALLRLSVADRELIVARLEFGLTYSELADAVGKPSVNAARMAVTRAVARLIEEIANDTGTTG